jgi:hypothetical protein
MVAHACQCVRARLCAGARPRMCAHACTRACARVCLCARACDTNLNDVRVRLSVHMCVCAFVCACVRHELEWLCAGARPCIRTVCACAVSSFVDSDHESDVHEHMRLLHRQLALACACVSVHACNACVRVCTRVRRDVRARVCDCACCTNDSACMRILPQARAWNTTDLPSPTLTHACTHERMHAFTHARMHACTHARMHACTHAHTHARTHARKHANTPDHLNVTCTHTSKRHSGTACMHARTQALTGTRTHTHAVRTHIHTHATP